MAANLVGDVLDTDLAGMEQCTQPIPHAHDLST